jgi:hypothetical protein
LDEEMDEKIIPCVSDIESSGNVDNCLEITTDFDMEDPYCWPPIINNRKIEIIIQIGPVSNGSKYEISYRR